MDAEKIYREIVLKKIEEVCGKLHPSGYYSTEYHVSSRNYSFGHTVYALVGDRLERLGGQIYAMNSLCQHLVKKREEIISNYDYIVVKIYERLLREVTQKIEVYRTDKENNKLIYLFPGTWKELYNRVKALLP